MDQFTTGAVRLAFFALPGLLACQFYRKLRGRRAKETWESFFEILIFSILSYLLWFFTLSCISDYSYSFLTTHGLPQPPDRSTFTGALFSDKVVPDWDTLFCWFILPSTSIGILLAAFASYIHRRQWITRLARKCYISLRSGDEDGWEFFFEHPDIRWVLVRDHKTNRCYYGFVRFFSESSKPRELVLLNVLVSANDTGKHLYNLQRLYIERVPNDLTIEWQVSPPPQSSVSKQN